MTIARLPKLLLVWDIDMARRLVTFPKREEVWHVPWRHKVVLD
jgi:hypothetical protein